jgi:hypothetical protein
MPLGGIVAISVVWVLTQLAVTAGARAKVRQYRDEYRKVAVQLAKSKELPGRLARAEGEQQALRAKGSAVTALTYSGGTCTDILLALAKVTPAELHLTRFTLDYAQRRAVLAGYGPEEETDIEVTLLLRALGKDETLLKTFTGATLDFCNNAKMGDNRIKKFSISLEFREGALGRLIRGELGGKEKNG